MQIWWLTAPRWAHCIAAGALFGAIWTVLSRLQGEPWAASLGGGVFGAVFFGLFFGWWLHRQIARTRELLAQTPGVDPRVVSRAARRGSVPDDPGVRTAALALVEQQQAVLRRQRVLQRVMWPVMIALGAHQAVSSSPWWWLAVALFVFFLVLGLVEPRRLDRRARALRGEPHLT